MKKSWKTRTARQNGFTLVELIVAITVAAIMGAMLVSFIGAALERSAEPINYASRMAELREVMENITADYYNLVDRQDVLTELERRIGSGDSNPNTGYGAYSATTRRISFLNGAEQSSPGSDYLKVTITPYGGEAGQSITTVFTAVPLINTGT